VVNSFKLWTVKDKSQNFKRTMKAIILDSPSTSLLGFAWRFGMSAVDNNIVSWKWVMIYIIYMA
jgi:hypothetical protein